MSYLRSLRRKRVRVNEFDNSGYSGEKKENAHATTSPMKELY